jgi:hypothetical protein
MRRPEHPALGRPRVLERMAYLRPKTQYGQLGPGWLRKLGVGLPWGLSSLSQASFLRRISFIRYPDTARELRPHVQGAAGSCVQFPRSGDRRA